MILLGRLCRCHYASNPAVSAAVRVACLSAFQASPGPRRPSLGPRLQAPPSDPQSSRVLLPFAPCGLYPSAVHQLRVCPRVSAVLLLLFIFFTELPTYLLLSPNSLLVFLLLSYLLNLYCSFTSFESNFPFIAPLSDLKSFTHLNVAIETLLCLRLLVKRSHFHLSALCSFEELPLLPACMVRVISAVE